MSGNFAIKGGGGGRLMANAILNFHFDFLHTSLRYMSGAWIDDFIISRRWTTSYMNLLKVLFAKVVACPLRWKRSKLS